MKRDYLAETMARLKDYSEMAIDLAYSAFMYGNQEIADHVLDMEKAIDRLHVEFELALLEQKDLDPRSLLGTLRLSMAAEQLVDAASVMAGIVKRGVRAHPIVENAMKGAEETILQTKISSLSVLANKSLGELGLEDDLGLRIIAVKRKRNWIYVPSDSFVLKGEDVIVARGYVEGRKKLLALADPNREVD